MFPRSRFRRNWPHLYVSVRYISSASRVLLVRSSRSVVDHRGIPSGRAFLPPPLPGSSIRLTGGIRRPRLSLSDSLAFGLSAVMWGNRYIPYGAYEGFDVRAPPNIMVIELTNAYWRSLPIRCVHFDTTRILSRRTGGPRPRRTPPKRPIPRDLIVYVPESDDTPPANPPDFCAIQRSHVMRALQRLSSDEIHA